MSAITQEKEKTVTVTEKVTPAQEFEDYEDVIVLHGYGRVHPEETHSIDSTLFVGGIARNVPYATAKHWQRHMRPDGKPATSRVHVHVLPSTATEADFVQATGIAPMRPEKMAAMVAALRPEDVIAALGHEKAQELLSGLQSRLLTTK